MKEMILDFDRYCDCARRAAAEGQVLLKNDESVLPFERGAKLAVFGRMQFHYYKSGTGSGGMVNVDRVIGILDALLECQDVIINKKVLAMYEKWEEANPFDEGIGWGNEPWSQKEMPLSLEAAATAAAESDYALVILARTAGEDQDNQNQPGSYLLTEEEEDLLSKIRRTFSKMVVVLNVGNIMDMSFIDRHHPEAVLYAWQGGMVGGLGTADVLTGAVSPSGKLTDTIAYRIEDYPSHANFGNEQEDLYQEDIYVGYRYFESVAKEAVRYPFGFGLSYTEFSIQPRSFSRREGAVSIELEVTNIGEVKGKEAVQIYVEAPQGKLGKPLRMLAAFQKTRELVAKESQLLVMEIPFAAFASYDDRGVSGAKAAFVLEAGEYIFYAGSNVRRLDKAGSMVVGELKIIQRCTSALAPVRTFERMKPVSDGREDFKMIGEEVPVRKESPALRREKELPGALAITGDQGYKLSDVKNGKISMEQFIAQLSWEDLSCIIRGEGMGSPKVTPGTAAAFGGISEQLKGYGIPCGCCSDGPSGMRLDCGMKAFSLPNGTLLACTFNEELVEELYTYTGMEMVKNKIDTLLGPGMNIHRHPLNGRNFEYFSEDPLITGKMAAAQLRGMHKSGVTGTVKHFCANNQETGRHELNSVVSERALREIYLKGYEIAVKEGEADSVMTTYGSVNGLWTAGSYDLNTVILRKDWGFTGIVMTDWWAKINEEGQPAGTTNFAAMARAQNDLYMVCSQADVNGTGDNTLTSLEEGTLTVGELQRNAANICRFLMHTHAFDRMNGIPAKVRTVGENNSAFVEEQDIIFYKVGEEVIISLEEIKAQKGTSFVFALDLEKLGEYEVELTAKSDLGELAQMPVTLFYQSVPFAMFTFNGTGGEWASRKRNVELHNKYAVLRLYFGQNGLEAGQIHFRFVKPLPFLT